MLLSKQLNPCILATAKETGSPRDCVIVRPCDCSVITEKEKYFKTKTELRIQKDISSKDNLDSYSNFSVGQVSDIQSKYKEIASNTIGS